MQVTKTVRNPYSIVATIIVVALLTKATLGFTPTGIAVFLGTTILFILLPRRMSIAVGDKSWLPLHGRGDFLELNGFKEGGEPSTQLSLTLEKGGSVEVGSVFFGSILGCPALIYDYLTWVNQKDTVTTGEAHKGDAAVRVLEVNLEHSFPRLYVSGKILPFLDDLLFDHPTLEKKVTEGIFDTNYLVYMQKGFGSESLELLTPDVMERVINDYPSLTFELTPGRLFIFVSPYEQNSYESLKRDAKFLIPLVLRGKNHPQN